VCGRDGCEGNTSLSALLPSCHICTGNEFWQHCRSSAVHRTHGTNYAGSLVKNINIFILTFYVGTNYAFS
jgi:hypothetical protein